jgi:hypothetical protein
MLNVAGSFPRAERCVVYLGKSTNTRGVADVRVNVDTMAVDGTWRSTTTLATSFENGLLQTDEKFFPSFSAPSLQHARDFTGFASKFATRAFLGPGHEGDAAWFSRDAALLLPTDANAFLPDGIDVTGLTACFWMQRQQPLDTLHPTLLSIGDAFAIRYFSFYHDIVVVVDGVTTRGRTTADQQSAQPGTAWTHVCGSTAPGGLTALYINGAKVTTSTAPTLWTTLTTTTRFSVGGDGDAALTYDRGFGGRVDDVMVFGRQLSDAEVGSVFAQ